MGQICLPPGPFHQGLDPYLQTDTQCPAPAAAMRDQWAQCVWGHQCCHQIHHPQMSCLRTPWISQTKGLFCRATLLAGEYLELSKIGCALVLGNCDIPPILELPFSSVQSLSHVRFFATPWTAACQASLSLTNSRNPPKPMSIESMMPSNHLILCCPRLFLASIFPSIRVSSNESALHIRWPKYWSFSFNISPSNEHPGLISFRMDWLDLLAVQGALKSLLQHHSSKASIHWHSAFFFFSFLYFLLFGG